MTTPPPACAPPTRTQVSLQVRHARAVCLVCVFAPDANTQSCSYITWLRLFFVCGLFLFVLIDLPSAFLSLRVLLCHTSTEEQHLFFSHSHMPSLILIFSLIHIFFHILFFSLFYLPSHSLFSLLSLCLPQTITK